MSMSRCRSESGCSTTLPPSLITVVVSRNLRIQPRASMSVSAFWIAFCWALLTLGELGTTRTVLGLEKRNPAVYHHAGRGKRLGFRPLERELPG